MKKITRAGLGAVVVIALAGLALPAMAQSGAMGAGGAEVPMGQGAEQTPAAAARGHFLASSLIGRDVMDTNGQTIGEVQDLVISNSGTLDGLVLAVGNFLGMGGKLVGIDLKHVRAAGDDMLTTSITRDQLDAAPDFAQRPVILR